MSDVDAYLVVMAGAAVLFFVLFWLLGQPAVIGALLFYGLIAWLLFEVWRWVRRRRARR